MKPFIGTLVGGVHDGQLVAVGADVQYLDVPTFSSDPNFPTAVRFRKKLWARVVDDATREIATDTFFVLDTLSDQEATSALLQRLKAEIEPEGIRRSVD